MRIWTILDEFQYSNLLEKGYYIADPNLAMFPDAYNWLSKIMRKIIPNKDIKYPVWGWYKYNNGKPDLRHKGHKEKGTKSVLIELELDDSKVLLSDFEYWHFVLNDWELSEDNEVISKEDSWNRIFDLDWCFKGDEGEYRNESRYIQATFWSFNLSDVRSIKKFIAK